MKGTRLRRPMALLLAALALVLLGASAEWPRHADVPGPARVGGVPAGQASRAVVVAVNNPLAALGPQAGTTPGLYDRAPRYAAGARARQILLEVARDHGLQALDAWPIPLLGVHCATFLMAPGADRDTVLARLASDPRVQIAQPLNEFETQGSLRIATAATTTASAPSPTAPPYDDPYLHLQENLRALDVFAAHRCARGAGVTLALIDTGVDTAHADLLGLSAVRENFVDADAGQFQRDRHGTEVAGLIAARPGNALGIAGIAPDARLLVLKACWQRTGGGSAVCNSFTLAQALSAAIERGAQVINLSLSGPPDPLLAKLVGRALAAGVLVVGAVPTGGDGSGFPAGVAGVIAVRDTASGGDALVAPARDVLTLAPGGRYDFGSGSSLAAAQVSAAAALMLQHHPGLDGAGMVRAWRRAAAHSPTGVPSLCDALSAVGAACPCGA